MIIACVDDIVNIIVAEQNNVRMATLRNKAHRDTSVMYSRQIYNALLKYDCHPEAVAAAIKHGKGVVVETIELLKECGGSDYDLALTKAAIKGRIDVMTLLKELVGSSGF